MKKAQDTYKMELAEYYKRRSEKEAEERRAARVYEAPYDKIWEALEELKAILYPNEEQEQLREVLRTTARGRTVEGLIPGFPLG
jgi:outer membrane protein assembly factor BamD (BamD/ComL family)